MARQSVPQEVLFAPTRTVPEPHVRAKCLRREVTGRPDKRPRHAAKMNTRPGKLGRLSVWWTPGARRRAVLPLLLLGVLLAACGSVTGTARPVSTITSHVQVTTGSVAVPPAPQPAAAAASCPYIA